MGVVSLVEEEDSERSLFPLQDQLMQLGEEAKRLIILYPDNTEISSKQKALADNWNRLKNMVWLFVAR